MDPLAAGSKAAIERDAMLTDASNDSKVGRRIANPATAASTAPTRAHASSATTATKTSQGPVGLGLLPDENRDYRLVSLARPTGESQESLSTELGSEGRPDLETWAAFDTLQDSPSFSRRPSPRINTNMSPSLGQLASPETQHGSVFGSPSLRSTSPNPGSSSRLAASLMAPRGSVSSNGSAVSPTASSFPMSRPPSYQSPTEQTPSRASGLHSRHGSLTSACAPVTADTSSPPTMRNPWYGNANGKEQAYNMGDRTGSSKAYYTSAPSEGLLLRILNLPAALLAYIVQPIHAPNQHSSPSLGSSSPAKPSRRQGALLRLVVLTYVGFCVIHFGASMLGLRSSTSIDREKAMAQVNHISDWAQKVRDGVIWPKHGNETVPDHSTAITSASVTVKRYGPAAILSKDPATNPLTDLTHPYRFAKIHDKLHWAQHEEIEPFAFRAASRPLAEDVTACLYTNEAWLQTLPSFVESWGGPVSLVLEASHSRTSPARKALLDKIERLRATYGAIHSTVDVHLVGQPATASESTLSRVRHRLVTKPLALNWQLNVARAFAETDILFIAGDARLTPSSNLRESLQSRSVREVVIDKANVVVVPSFAFARDPTDEKQNIPSPQTLRKQLSRPGPATGIDSKDFAPLAQAYVSAIESSTPLERGDWPDRKDALISLVENDAGSPPQLVMWDTRWEPNHGPTNWYLWRKLPHDSRLDDSPDLGGGNGLGPDGELGGGDKLYRIIDYDLHFAPHVVISRRGQPWCTERFESMSAACTYQMYLSGAELYALPDAWLYTLEPIEKPADPVREDPVVRLKNSISARLYGKFHQEACMHYGRELLSVAMWNSDKAQHLRSVCAKTLWTWHWT